MLPPYPTETEPLLAHRWSSHSEPVDPDAPHLRWWKLLPVVALASICRGMSMFSRYGYYKRNEAAHPAAWFRVWVEMPEITLRMEMWSIFASLVVSFVSVGWWSAFGDRHGRKPVLFVSLLGAMLLDLIFLAVSRTQFEQDGISLGLIVEGLLGGFATFNGAVYAYACDVPPRPVSRTVVFSIYHAATFLSFRFGAFLGLLAHPGLQLEITYRHFLGFIISIFLTIANLAYIYYGLPESLKSRSDEQRPVSHGHNFESAAKSVMSPFFVFLRGGFSRKPLILLVLSAYMYSMTSAFSGKMAAFTAHQEYFPAFSRSFLLIFPNLLSVLTWLGIIPCLAFFFKRAYGNTVKSGRLFAKSIAQNSILLAAASAGGMLIFGGAGPLFTLFFFTYSFSAAALPAMYSLADSYLGRGSESGALFGGLSMWVLLGEYISYCNMNDNNSGRSLAYQLRWTSVLLIISLLLLLVPDGSPMDSDEGTAFRGEEGV